ncbi:MAG: MarR family transcriptional regulator [Chloroflexi bacterium]|nr:MarR family transcriptional regulator [Chloroflexota bacterium]
MAKPVPDTVDFALVQVCRLHYARAQTLLEQIGLYRGQPPLLGALWQQEGLTHSELAERLDIQPATTTRMIQRMEKAGFVQRRQDAEDERVSRVYLTDAGRAIQEDVQRVWRQLEEETLDGLTLHERDLLRGLLLRMRDNLLRAGGKSLSV